MANASLKGPDIGERILKLQRAVVEGRVKAVNNAANEAKKQHLAVMRSDSGGDLALSGVNRRKGRLGGAKLNVTFRTQSSGMNASALLRATGPLQLINNPTSGHVIRSSYAGGRTRGFVGPVAPGQFGGGRRAVLNIPGVGFRRSVRHPGTKGKDTWQQGRKKAEPVIAKEMRKTTTKTIASGMKP